MHRVEPRVFFAGEMKLVRGEDGIDGYLNHIGTSWRPQASITDNEALVEIMGRVCYRSFEAGLNKNVTKVREGNDVYLKHILDVGHGSVTEHTAMSFLFVDVSRVFTHEVVRHRVGVAVSQESLRYVRLTDLGLWLPHGAQNDPKLVQLFETTFQNLEEIQLKLANYLKLDDQGVGMTYKKEMTSLMRRLAPIGLATSIGLTFNTRSLRHTIEMRTAVSAEAEIRYVFDKLATMAKDRWPNLFQDFERNEAGEWISKNRKI